MAKRSGMTGPHWPRFGKLCGWLLKKVNQACFSLRNVHQWDAPQSHVVRERAQAKLARGEDLLIAGLGVAGHNAGASLIRVSHQRGIELLGSDEEERFTGLKHYGEFPQLSLQCLAERLAKLGRTAEDIDAWGLSWDYIALAGNATAEMMGEFPFSWRTILPGANPKLPFLKVLDRVRSSSAKLKSLFQLQQAPTLIAMPHHGNHAAFSYAASPFAKDGEPTLILVLDGMGDTGAISAYTGNAQGLKQLYCNDSFVDSLGMFYSVISSTQGGWTTLSSEGRYMGAAAWGDSNRLTNQYYRRLREIFHFEANGEILVNRHMANWQNAGEIQPYKPALEAVVGPPIAKDRMWNPDAILSVDNVQHETITRDRVDLAAATQLVFEDALFHIVDHYVRSTGISRLVVCGGTALNCVANMRLLEHFSPAWFERNLNRATQLQLWVPPIPGDAGVAVGSAYQLALGIGAPSGEPLQHAFYCGRPAATGELDTALNSDPEIEYLELGSIQHPEELEAIADLMAYIMSENGVLGLFQGAAEIGPRALGHRSILANPCNPLSLQIINERVKFREKVRPLAPMVTREAAEKYWELSPGAAANDYSAYNYMVLTVPAKPLGYLEVPAVIHFDGTSRIQIVRPECDPLTHAYLKAMGRRVGAEVSVNTSLNVGSPIAQTASQALDAMKKAKSLSGLIMVGEDGAARLVWHAVEVSPKDGGRQLQQWIASWRKSTGATLDMTSTKGTTRASSSPLRNRK